MLSSGIIDLAIGIIFVFGATAAIVSVVTEAISRFLGLRGAYLLLGLRELLDGDDTVIKLDDAKTDFADLRTLINHAPAPPPDGARARAAVPSPDVPADNAAAAQDPAAAQQKPKSATGALLGSPILRNQGMPGQITTRPLMLDSADSGKNKLAPLPRSTRAKGARKDTRTQRRSLPSYIPAQSFAEAVMDLLVPDAGGQTTMNTIQYYIGQLPDSMGSLRSSLEALAANAAGDITLFRTSIERWYDDHMARVSGWYKRHVTIITLAVGAVLVLLLNINTLTIGRALYSDSTIRSAVSAVAAKGANCPNDQPNCLGNLEDQLAAAAGAGLPLGWATVADCAGPNAKCNWWEQRGIISRHGNPAWEFILLLLGFLVTTIAIAPGAQFWFGLLVKVNALRTSGTPPSTSAS